MQKYNAASVAVNPSSATAPVKSLAEVLNPSKSAQSAELPMYNNRQLGRNFSVSEPSNIGLDTFTIVLRVDDCRISPTFPAKVLLGVDGDGALPDAFRILWKDTSGRLVDGVKAILKSTNFNFTIQGNEKDVYVIINASARAFAETNVELMDEARFRYVIQCIENELKEKGLKCNLLKDAYFTRMDISRNVHLEHLCSAYIGAFHTYSRARGAQFLPIFHGDSTLLLKMSKLEVSIYDKGKEQAKKLHPRKKPPASHTMRGEVRLLEAAQIKKHFRVEKLSPADLLSDGRFPELPNVYRGVLETSLLDTERAPQQAILMSDNNAFQLAEIERRVSQLVDRVGSPKYHRLVVYGLHVAAYGVDGARAWYVENVQKGETEAAKRSRRTFETELRAVAVILGATVEESSGLTHDELYTELKAKMLE
jgi:hypothetical protein